MLLCNGKDQYQAHEGLVDFLGEDTNSFVAWFIPFLLFLFFFLLQYYEFHFILPFGIHFSMHLISLFHGSMEKMQ